MKNKHKSLGILGVIALLSALSITGCTVPQLAVAQSETENDKDLLVGVYITSEPLDLFDIEAYLEENLGAVINGGSVSSEDEKKYGGRVYAELTKAPFTEDGMTHTRYSYDFPELKNEGMLFGSFLVDDEGEPFTMIEADEGLSDLHTALNHTDAGETTTQSAVIYQESDSIIYYFNPVYQREDGAVYLTEGEGVHVSAGLGGSMTETMKDSVTTNKNGVTETLSSEIIVKVETAYAPDTARILQMDENHTILSCEEYTPEALPDEVTLLAETAYVLIETKRGAEVSRILWQDGDDAPYVFRSLGNGICVKETVSFRASEK